MAKLLSQICIYLFFLIQKILRNCDMNKLCSATKPKISHHEEVAASGANQSVTGNSSQDREFIRH